MNKLLSEGINVNATGKSGATALQIAAERGNAATVRLLAGKGAQVDRDSSYADHETPLMLAARAGHQEVVNTLLDLGAHVNRSGKDGWTPLMRAARGNHAPL